MADENDIAPSEESGGSLADAIAAHLALKKEHGADPETVESELEDALSPPRRDPEPEPEQQVAAPEPEPAPEPVAQQPVAQEEEAPEAPAPTVEDGSEADPDPITEEEVASSVEEPKPGEITGTIEFEFGDEETSEEQDQEPAAEHDLLEDTPDFFEETPEHDKLWFDEAPPRKFDF